MRRLRITTGGNPDLSLPFVTRRKALKTGEAGFLQGREMVTQRIAGSETHLTKTETTPAQILEYFGETQAKEIAFNEGKKRKALIEQLLLKVLRPEDISPELIQMAEAYSLRVAKNQKENTSAQKLAQKRVTQKQAGRYSPKKRPIDTYSILHIDQHFPDFSR